MKSVSAITSRPGAGAAVAGMLIGAGIMLVGALLLNDAVTAKLTSLAPPVTALVVAYVGLQQWLTAREKVRLDLYTRRFANLQTAVRYFQVALHLGLELKIVRLILSMVPQEVPEFLPMQALGRVKE